MRGRQRFKCVDCGLEVEGRENVQGEVRAYDRAGYDGSPVCKARCAVCDPDATWKAVHAEVRS